MRQGGEPQGVQVVRQGEPTPYHCDFNSLYDALSDSKFLYFVSRMDGTGKSQFSHTLEEHNAAVKQYILKK